MKFNRVVLIVLDSVGIGYLPDADLYGDQGSNTLSHIVEEIPDIKIPNMIALGLGNIDQNNALQKVALPTSAFGKAMEQSAGKDTTTGHFEIAGSVLAKPFPTFPHGFPKDFIQLFEEKIGVQTIGNFSASGTEIINQLGDEHLRTGFPIIYTSADSVFQIAMHEDVFPIEQQYQICQIARDMLVGDLEVGRVIARPFTGKSGHYTRTSRRKDFATLPPDNVMDAIINAGLQVYGIGKINDIFAGKAISKYIKTANNQEGINATLEAIKDESNGLIFANLVDFDMYFGHRRDVQGYANCLEEFDVRLPELVRFLKDDDLLIITADHGNDPTWHGTDHTREHIPILNIGKYVQSGTNIGTRSSFADIAATISEALGIEFATSSVSYLDQILVRD